MRHAHLIPFLILLLTSCGDDDGGPDDGGTEVGPDAADVSTEPSLEVGPDAAIEEGLRIEGLSAGVSAHFDAAGVLSLDCATNEDCVAALGYFHARDRFVQMDFRRRVTSGRLSGILSSFAADLAEPVDVSNRALYSTRSGMPLEDTVLEAATEEVRGVLEAYASGVNAWIADVQAGRNGAIFPREFENGLLFDYSAERIPAWRPEDSVSTVLALIDSLTNDSDAEIRRGVARAEFIERFGAAEGEQRFRDLFDVSTEVEAPILDGFGEMASRTPDVMQCAPRGNPALPVGTGATLLAENDAAFGLFGERFLGQAGGLGGFGSNNWVVAPELSASGNALFANDPHLGMSNPSTWYVAHMDASTNGSGDLHVAGMTFAGLPFVIIGQNENIAWGATTTNFDMTDVYVEEVSDDGTTVTFRGEQVPIITRTFAVDRADGTSNEFELAFVPHHGPVLQAESEDGPMLSLRWTGNDTTTDINFLTSLSRASTVEEAQTALRQITTIGQNWVIADTAGNIGWFPYNRVPERPWATSYDPASGTEAIPWLPLDGRGDFEWESFYDFEELPQALNPREGFVATANGDMTGALEDGDPTNDAFGVFQTSVAPGYRQRRIVNLLEANDAHTPDTMAALIADTHSQIGEDLTPLLLTAAEGLTLSANGDRVVNALSGWAFDCPTGLVGTDAETADLAPAAELSESAGCAAFHVAIRTLNEAVVGDDGVAPERGPNIVVVRLLRGEALLAGDVYWDNLDTEDEVESREDVITAAFNAAGDVLVEALGENEAEWAWGRMHTLTLQSDVDAASGGLVTSFNESGFANDGGLFTVDVANPNADYTQTAGASMRLLCEALEGGVACTFQVPGGPSAHPDDASYLSLLPDYLSNTPRPLPMDIAAAATDAAETLEVTAP